MTDPTQDQKARWLDVCSSLKVAMSFRGEMILSAYATIDDVLALCATITAEALEAERARVTDGVEMTDGEIEEQWSALARERWSTFPIVDFARTLIAEASARATLAERERCARWQPIETAPRDERFILAWSPRAGALVLSYWIGRWREPANGLGLKDAPTHWMPLPDGPSDAAHRAGEGE